MASRKTIDQVTVILGYVQLSSRKVPCDDAELRAAIERLRELARADNRGELTEALDAPGQEMDQERTA